MDISYKIFPLGDTAACIEFGNVIDENINRKVIAMHDWLYANPFEGLKDIIVAYSSISLYYNPIVVHRKKDPQSTVFDFVRKKLEDAYFLSIENNHEDKNIIHVPVCYENEFGADMEFICREKNLFKEEIIQLHTSKTYRVYMIGFLPGFSYLGKIDEKLIVPRKPKPAIVAAGSVGIAGSQTGIYPLVCPGGWQIIGRTPLKFFDANATVPVTLKIGDYVQFYEIPKLEFVTYSK